MVPQNLSLSVPSSPAVVGSKEQVTGGEEGREIVKVNATSIYMSSMRQQGSTELGLMWGQGGALLCPFPPPETQSRTAVRQSMSISAQKGGRNHLSVWQHCVCVNC